MFRREEGFTLLEILLVVAAIAILAGIVILALNPSKQLADTRNSERWSDVNTVLNAVYQYSIDNDGAIPADIPTDTAANCLTNAAAELCKDQDDGDGGSIDCDTPDFVDLYQELVGTNETYLVAIPTDPNYTSATGAGYHIIQSANGRLTVCAPEAEEGEVISVTR